MSLLRNAPKPANRMRIVVMSFVDYHWFDRGHIVTGVMA